jgi:ABC-type spermidine/putrescine transport system permease subunit I
MMSSGLNSVPNALIEAARDSGASLPRTVRSVLLPMNVIPTVIVASFTGIYVLGSFTVPYLTGPSAPNLMGPSMANFFSAFNQPQQAEVMAMIVFVLAAGIGTAYVWANVRAAKRASATS